MLRSNRLFAGHAAGAYTLPADVLKARAAVERLNPLHAQQNDPTNVHADLVERTITAAAEGTPLPNVDELLVAQEARREADAQESIYDGARQVAVARLVPCVQNHIDEILTDHLQPVLDAVMVGAKQVAERVPVDTDDRQLLLADAPTRKLWSGMDELVNRYSVVRGAQSELYGLSPLGPTDEDEWAAFDDLVALWPEWPRRNTFRGSTTAPWPTDPRSFLLWLAHHNARPVALTVTERNRREDAKYGEARRQHAQDHRSAMAVGAGTWVA